MLQSPGTIIIPSTWEKGKKKLKQSRHDLKIISSCLHTDGPHIFNIRMFNELSDELSLGRHH